MYTMVTGKRGGMKPGTCPYSLGNAVWERGTAGRVFIPRQVFTGGTRCTFRRHRVRLGYLVPVCPYALKHVFHTHSIPYIFMS